MKKKYIKANKKVLNKYAESITNPTVQPDGETEMKAPIPCTQNVEYSKEWGEEHET